MQNETGKTRSQRIRTDYYKQADDLSRWRIRCIVVAVLLSAFYTIYAIGFASPQSQLSTGPVANVHASFEDDCQQCHLEFNPVANDAKQIDLPMVGIDADQTLRQTEAKCQHCHQVGDHFRKSMTADAAKIDQNCSACHHDHMGRHFDMVGVANNQCTHCHADLRLVSRDAPSVRQQIVHFDEANHGNFRSLGLTDAKMIDPGVVKFDHSQHMLPGQVEKGQRGGTTWSMLSKTDRVRYGDGDMDQSVMPDDEMVQLQCVSCHSMDTSAGTDSSVSPNPPRAGRYMAPIDFETHCAACHPILPATANEQTPTLPHAVSWNQIDLLIAGISRGQESLQMVRALGDDTQTTPKLGEGTGEVTMMQSGSELPAGDWQRSSVEDQCRLCHDDDALQDDTISAAKAGVLPPMIPSQWMTKGLYDHAVHRQIDCRYCHQQAYGDDDQIPLPSHAKNATTADDVGPNDHTVVMIGGIATCQDCHRDAETTTPANLLTDQAMGLFGGSATWASDQCTLCHGYHSHSFEQDGAWTLSLMGDR